MSNIRFSLIFANTVPLVLVLTGHLDAAQMLVLYWMETVIMGIMTVLCILFAEGSRNPLSQRLMDIAEGNKKYGSSSWKSRQGRSGLAGSIGTAVFFTVRGGLLLIFSAWLIFGYVLGGLPGADLRFSMAMLNLMLGWNPVPETNYYLMMKPLFIPLAALALGHIWSFVRDFWHDGQGRFFNSGFYSGIGLLRILSVLLTSVFAGYAARFAGAAAGIYVVAVLVFVKTVFDHQFYAANTAFPDGGSGEVRR
jgi:hypothetical protein